MTAARGGTAGAAVAMAVAALACACGDGRAARAADAAADSGSHRAPDGADRATGAGRAAPGAARAAGDARTSAGAGAARLVLPAPAGPLAPARAIIPPSRTGADLADIDRCGGCHADIARQWSASAHAFASVANNPIYRASVDAFGRATGARAVRVCAGCHDAALLADGVDVAGASPADPRAAAGVSCAVCHGVVRVTADGNGSYTLAEAPIPLPRAGDPESVQRHRSAAAPAVLRSAALCGACHRGFLAADTGHGHFLPGMDELGAWRRSAYAGSGVDRVDAVEPRDCIGCHMPRVDAPDDPAADARGQVASHRFAGGHSWLAAMIGDPDQQAAIDAQLRGAASVFVSAVVDARGRRWLPAEAAPIAPGDAIEVDVVVRNDRVGHRFPGGTRDAQDTWIELRVVDARGRTIGASGTRWGDGRGDAHVLAARAVDDRGRPAVARDVHRFRAVAYDHTVPPRAARLARFRVDVPATAVLPLRVAVRLRHRSRALAVQRAACRAWRRGRARPGAGAAVDPCAPQPITDIARAEAVVGGPGAGGAAAVDARRAYDDGRAWLAARQDDAAAGADGLERAWAAGGGLAAAAAVARGRLAARQGRYDEAVAWLERAAAAGAPAAAVAAARADAAAGVWQWAEAARDARRAAVASPADDRAWARLARAELSAGRADSALAAAARGLALAPRSAELLLVQAIAAARVGHPAADAALAAYLAHRPRDDAPALRARCAARDPRCARERVPAHVHSASPP